MVPGNLSASAKRLPPAQAFALSLNPVFRLDEVLARAFMIDAVNVLPELLGIACDCTSAPPKSSSDSTRTVVEVRRLSTRPSENCFDVLMKDPAKDGLGGPARAFHRMERPGSTISWDCRETCRQHALVMLDSRSSGCSPSDPCGPNRTFAPAGGDTGHDGDQSGKAFSELPGYHETLIPGALKRPSFARST